MRYHSNASLFGSVTVDSGPISVVVEILVVVVVLIVVLREYYLMLANEGVHLTLFKNGFVQKDFNVPFLMNFRGGNVPANVDVLHSRGITFEKDLRRVKEIYGDALIQDPNGHKIYLDADPSEVENRQFVGKLRKDEKDE